MKKRLSIVLKTVERCNIDCSYCYFFYGGDESYKKHPPYIPRKTIDKLVEFLQQGIKELGLSEITIGFHGGEPLMQKKSDFIYTCQTLKKSLADRVALDFTLQTNATLISDEWIDVLSAHNIGVGSRFSKENNFNNPSVFCNGLSNFYAHVAAYMIKSNYSADKIMKNIGIKYEMEAA